MVGAGTRRGHRALQGSDVVGSPEVAWAGEFEIRKKSQGPMRGRGFLGTPQPMTTTGDAMVTMASSGISLPEQPTAHRQQPQVPERRRRR